MMQHFNVNSSSIRSTVRKRRGFTLLELLIAMVLISILAALGVSAYIRSLNTAKVTATETLIQILDNALELRIKQYQTMNVPLDSATISLFRSGASDPAGPGSTAAQRALIAKRLQLMQMAFPQQFWDMLPYTTVAGDPGVFVNPATQGLDSIKSPGEPLFAQFARQFKLNPVTPLQPPNYDVTDPNRLFDPQDNAIGIGWQALLFPSEDILGGSTELTNPEFAILHDPDTESSECLYLILSSTEGGIPSPIPDIPQQFKADTDGDGLMEFVDAWGNPLRFYRCPTDYYAYLIDITREIPITAARNDMDPENLLTNFDPVSQTQVTGTHWFNNNERRDYERAFSGIRLHAAYDVARDPTSTPDADMPRIYPTKPLIISAGHDGKFGFLTKYSTSASDPIRRSPMPQDGATANAASFYSDPNFLSMRCGRIDPEEIEYLADNISNVSISSSQSN